MQPVSVVWLLLFHTKYALNVTAAVAICTATEQLVEGICCTAGAAASVSLRR